VTLAAPEIDDDLTLTSSQSRWPSSCSSLLAFWEAGGTADASKLSGNDFLAVQPRPRLLDEGVLFLDQALLMVNCRAEAIKLLPAKRAETRTVYAIELSFQPTPLSKAEHEVAVQSDQSVGVRIALGAFVLSFHTLCHDLLLFALSAAR